MVIGVCVLYLNRKSQKYSAFSESQPKPFDCNKCGNCCKLLKKLIEHKNDVDLLPEVRKMINEFPYKYNQSGECEKLVNNQCSVYESRPDVCNVDKSWERAFKNIMTLQEYYNINKKVCQSSDKLVKQLTTNV